MLPLFIQYWFDNAFAKAIGWTLVHSLWQGLIVAAVAGLLLLTGKQLTPARRYKLLAALFAVFLLGALTTFFIQWQAHTEVIPIAATMVEGTPAALTVPHEFSSIPRVLSVEAFTTYFNNHVEWIVATWFVIFLIRALRLTGYVGYAYRLRRYKTVAVPAWQKKIEELAVQMKMQTKVILRESAIIKVPVVIGFFKPVILLPLGILYNLPMDQVEAILLHELAHIRRKDYLVNLLQCVGETVFFFHPAVWWLSSLIRQERENCCDDMAIAANGNKTIYVQALASFHEYVVSPPLYAPAFPGEKYPVLQRIRRIIYNNNKNLSNMEKVFLSSGLILTTVLALAFTTHRNNPREIIKPVQQQTFSLPAVEIKQAGVIINPVKSGQDMKPGGIQPEAKPSSSIETDIVFQQDISVNDTVPTLETKLERNITGTFTTREEGKDYTMILKNNVITGLFIDNERVPDEKIAEYKPLTDRIIQRSIEKSEAAKKQAEKMRKNAATMKVNEQEWKENEKRQSWEEVQYEIKHGDGEQQTERETRRRMAEEKAKAAQEGNKKIREKADNQQDHKKPKRITKKEAARMEKKMLEAEKDHMEKMEQRKAETHIGRDNAKRQELRSEEQRQRAEEQKERTREQRERAEEQRERRKESQEAREKWQAIRQEIIDDLASNHLIQDKKNVSLKLDHSEMIVNGVKQPDDMHQKFRKKFIEGNSTINFNYQSTKED